MIADRIGDDKKCVLNGKLSKEKKFKKDMEGCGKFINGSWEEIKNTYILEKKTREIARGGSNSSL